MCSQFRVRDWFVGVVGVRMMVTLAVIVQQRQILDHGLQPVKRGRFVAVPHHPDEIPEPLVVFDDHEIFYPEYPFKHRADECCDAAPLPVVETSMADVVLKREQIFLEAYHCFILDVLMAKTAGPVDEFNFQHGQVFAELTGELAYKIYVVAQQEELPGSFCDTAQQHDCRQSTPAVET